MREYLLDASDDLEARDPSFFSHITDAVLVFSSLSIANPLNLVLSYDSRDVGRVASKGIHVAERIAENPLVQAATTVLPGGAEIVAAESVFPSMCGATN
jgi:hypothetical protein